MNESHEKELGNKIRSMRGILSNEHGIDVPYTALRAAVIKSMGFNPHSFFQENRPATVAAQDVIEEERKEWVEWWTKEHDVELNEEAYNALLQAPKKINKALVTRTLYLSAEKPEYGRVSLDLDRKLLFTNPWVLHAYSVDAVRVRAVIRSSTELAALYPGEIPSDRQLWPSYIASSLYSLFNIWINESTTVTIVEPPDGEPSGYIEVEFVQTAEKWHSLMDLAFGKNPKTYEDLEEWVGLNYQRIYRNESSKEKLEWMDRYIASLNGKELE